MYQPIGLECGHAFCADCAFTSAGKGNAVGSVRAILDHVSPEACCPECRTKGVYILAIELKETEKLIKQRCGLGHRILIMVSQSLAGLHASVQGDGNRDLRPQHGHKGGLKLLGHVEWRGMHHTAICPPNDFAIRQTSSLGKSPARSHPATVVAERI